MASQAGQDPLLTIPAPGKKFLGPERSFPSADPIGEIQVQDAASSGIAESGTLMAAGISTGGKYASGRWPPGWDGMENMAMGDPYAMSTVSW